MADMQGFPQPAPFLTNRVLDVYAVAGTYIYRVPVGVYRIYVEVYGASGGCGGGGASGTGNGYHASGSGGQGALGQPGGYSAGFVDVTPGQEFQVVVGVAGAGGAGGSRTANAILALYCWR